jgi:SAM-dependent methyltransferase
MSSTSMHTTLNSTAAGREAYAERLKLAASAVGYTTLDRYRKRADFIFEGVTLARSTFLEVGCGRGAWAIWAALHGASRCIGLEPEVDGCTPGTMNKFRENVARLHLDDVIESYPCTLQDFLPGAPELDVVMMYNVVNHIDEYATIHMHEDESLQQRYIELLAQLRSRMKPGGKVIISDSARSNLWPALGLRCPFEPAIEWEKHQDPPMWTRVFRAAGFELQASRWSPIYPFGKLSTSTFVQYLTRSLFVITYTAA